MHADEIARLLKPFLGDAALTVDQLEQVSAYLDLLVRWNARMNLTAVRDASEMVTRHFGESFFAGLQLFPANSDANQTSLADVGSGAGFPGLPIKILRPSLRVTLIEANHKKATFLREVIRTLGLQDVAVMNARAEEIGGDIHDVVTMRAVERFDAVLPEVAKLVAPTGRITLLIGESQVEGARAALPAWSWQKPLPTPDSEARLVLIGGKVREKN